MDLGCLDIGCITVLEKHKNEATVVDLEKKGGDSEDSPTFSYSSKFGKNKVSKGTGLSAHTAVNKSYSQMKKPHRKSSSPLNWFPRKKVDSYLKRKIRLLQEVGGMTSTLDETLGDSNPHYSRVLREKIAASEAACTAMEARKAAMVEASWCRILRAARIQSKTAEALLLEAEKNVAEAFEAAAALGVIMYDTPDCPRKPCEVESSSVSMGGSTTHTVTASFETAFEVDKEVAAAVKVAFLRLASCSSSLNEDEHRDLLRRISSQNPDTNESNEEVSDFSSSCELETGTELDTESQGEMADAESRRKSQDRQFPCVKSTKLVDVMLERLKCLQEDELASLATIVATCGLNAALLEVENTKHHGSESGINSTKSCSLLGGGTARRFSMDHSKIGPARRKQVVQELPSLDKFLVKHMSKLEIEVQEAKNRRKNHAQGGSVEENLEGSESRLDSMSSNVTTSEAVPDLGNVLLKHVSKLEKEIEVAKKTSGREFEMKSKQLGKTQRDVSGLPSLDKFLVKHVSRLEREVQEAKNSRKNDLIERKSKPNSDSTAVSSPAVADLHDMGDSSSEVGKENIGPNKQVNDALCGAIREVVEKMHPENHGSTTFSIEHNSSDWSEKSSVTIRPMSRIERAKLETMKAFSFQDGNARSESESSLDKILVKPVHRLEKEKKQALALGMGYGNLSNKLRHEYTNNGSHCDSLDKVLVKHVSRLEKEKMEHSSKEEVKEVRDTDSTKNYTDSLDQILVKHQSQLEKEKLGLVKQPVDEIKHSKTRREARERELQEAWGGLSLGSSVRPHLSRLERDKAAWTKAEEEARIRARREMET